MERQNVESSQMRSVGWELTHYEDELTDNAKTVGVLEVEFATGAIYRYDNVEQEVFNAFISAESKGRYFGTTIKANPTKYPYEKIQDAPVFDVQVNGNILVKWDGRETTCKSCSAKIGWGKTEAGKRMPFNLSDHTAHFATCPQAKEFRK